MRFCLVCTDQDLTDMHLQRSKLEQKLLSFLQAKEAGRFQRGQKQYMPDMVQRTCSNATLAIILRYSQIVHESRRAVCASLQPAVAARFCPKLFEASTGGAEGSPFDLPYRMVFAVATVETVIIYDTTGQQPLAVLGGLHFEAAPITDIAWSCEGRYLAISSYDGEHTHQ